MIDKWFIDDINKAAAGEGRVVVTDARKEGKFLLNYLPSQFVLLPVASSDLDEIKEKAVECMEEYISQQDLSDEDKEKMKENHKQWADMILKGIKQRLYDCGKIENDLQLNI